MFTTRQTQELGRDGFVPETCALSCHHDQNFVSPPKTVMTCHAAELSDLPRDVLIVEDDPIIAIDFEDRLFGFGIERVRSANSVARALQAIMQRAPDFALLDVELVNEKSFAVAERLAGLKIPFAFVTGYGAEVRIPAEFAERPRLQKPCGSDALKAALRSRRTA